MKKIIAPTDFSEVSMNAVNYATNLAIAMNASLSLIHVCPFPVQYAELPVPPDTLPEMIEEAIGKMNKLKERLNILAAGKIDIYIEVGSGDVISQLQDYCNLIQPDFVIMSPHEASDLERLFLGSTTLAAVKYLDWPLIVVPANTQFNHIRKIGLACGLENAREAFPIDLVKSIVQDFGAELHVLHVHKGKEYSQETIDQAEWIIPLIDELKPVYHFVDENNVQRGLKDLAEIQQLDLMIVVPRHRHLPDSLFHKSQTKQLVLNTNVPLMTVHA